METTSQHRCPLRHTTLRRSSQADTARAEQSDGRTSLRSSSGFVDRSSSHTYIPNSPATWLVSLRCLAHSSCAACRRSSMRILRSPACTRSAAAEAACTAASHAQGCKCQLQSTEQTHLEDDTMDGASNELILVGKFVEVNVTCYGCAGGQQSSP